MSVNVLTLTKELRDTQERLRNSDAKCTALQEENIRLKALVRDSDQSRGKSNAKEPLSEANDRLLLEVKQQLAQTIKRNTLLEQELQDGHSALRRQYEAHIDKLELELRRCKVSLGASQRPLGSTLAATASANSFQGLATNTSAGRTPETRRNLL